MDAGTIEAILFDKDGTLLDFQRTWGPWSARVVRELAADGAAPALAERLGVDLARGRVASGSVIVAGTFDDIAEAIGADLGITDVAGLSARLTELARHARPYPVRGLEPTLAALAAAGLRLGIATNDAEAVARDQVAALGLGGRFQAILGFDSGYGGKPAPGMCLAFAERIGIAPARIAMVGDSLHDLHAGRAAGMVTIAVQTGPAPAEALAPHADVMLASVAELPRWLSRRG